MWTNLKHKELYLLVLGLGLLICLTAVGGGLFNQTGPWFRHWQHKAFTGLCHQDPQRSFWINDTPMAVCSRCLGIYFGFTVLWILFPLRIHWVGSVKDYGKMILAGIVLLNILDITGNSLGLWENTLFSRYLMGMVIGMFAAIVLSLGFTGKQQQKGKHHGTVRTH